MELYNAPLIKRDCQDLFSTGQVQNDLAEFTFDYLFSGTRTGEVIELFVMTWVIDTDSNLFIRYCSYMGKPKNWKELIQDQVKNLMVDINIGAAFVKSSLRFFEVDNDHYRDPEQFEKEFLELKAKVTRE